MAPKSPAPGVPTLWNPRLQKWPQHSLRNGPPEHLHQRFASLGFFKVAWVGREIMGPCAVVILGLFHTPWHKGIRNLNQSILILKKKTPGSIFWSLLTTSGVSQDLKVLGGMFFFFLSGGGRGNNEQVLVNLRTCATSILHENCWWGNNIPEKKNNSKLHSPTKIPFISWPKHVRKRHRLADCYIPQQLEYYNDEVFQHKSLQMWRTTYGVKWWLQVWVPNGIPTSQLVNNSQSSSKSSNIHMMSIEPNRFESILWLHQWWKSQHRLQHLQSHISPWTVIQSGQITIIPKPGWFGPFQPTGWVALRVTLPEN